MWLHKKGGCYMSCWHISSDTGTKENRRRRFNDLTNTRVAKRTGMWHGIGHVQSLFAMVCMVWCDVGS